jgi:hypothetical protein
MKTLSEERINLFQLVGAGAHALGPGAAGKRADPGAQKTSEDGPDDWSIVPRTSCIFLTANVSGPKPTVCTRPRLLHGLDELGSVTFQTWKVTEGFCKGLP